MTPNRILPKCLARLCVWSMLALGSAAVPVSAFDDPPADRAKLDRDMQAAYRAGNYQKALDLCEKLQKLEPENPTHLYNLGCLNCLTDHKAKAYEWLEKAVDAGWKDVDQLEKDKETDFRTIRGEDRFRALLKRVRDGEKGADRVKKKERDKDQDDGDDDDDDDAQAAAKSKKVEKPERPKKDAKPKKEEDDDQAGDDKNEEVQELTRDLVKAAEDKDYDKALKLALKANKIADNGLTNYNVACMYSLKGEKDKAFDHLERAVKRGNFPMDLVTQMEQDKDLDNLRQDERYEKIVEMAKAGGKGNVRDAGKKVKFEWKVTLPHKQGDAEKSPLLVVLHEKGGNMRDTTDEWTKAADKLGVVILAPQGTFKINRNRFQWGRDVEAIEDNVKDAIEKVATEHGCDKSRIVLAGFSEGGSLAWTLALRNPEMFRGLIPVRGRCDVKSESVFDDDDVAKLRVYALCGSDDDKGLIKTNKDAAKKLEKKGAKAKVVIIDAVAHAFPENSGVELEKALNFVLGE